jgi:hypothetical protein
MRLVLAIAVMSAAASAGDLGVGASIGAGAQGAATYGAVELRLDAAWPGVRLGFGVRGVWDDGVYRREFARAADAVAIVRDVELVQFFGAPTDGDGGRLALAAGRLAPAHVGHIADGYRATLDDRWRTGVRGAASTRDVEASVEIDDVLDPALIGGAVRWQMAPPFGLHLAIAGDPAATTVVEAGGSRRYETRDLRADVGVAIVAELGLGVSGVAFVDGALQRDDVRWTLRADARAGTGTNGAMFGPLYRVERLEALWARARRGDLDGGALGATLGVAAPIGWLELGARVRPGLGPLAIASAGAPMSKRWQAALWAAAGTHDGAGAAEARVAWSTRLFSALQAARLYQLDAMEPRAVWSLTAWFGATSE